MQLNFKDIVLIPNKSVLNSRSEADTSAKLGKHTFKVPVCGSNMPAIQTWDIIKQFDRHKWFYVYHRMGGIGNVTDFVDHANRYKYRIVSISVGISEQWQYMLSELSFWGCRIDYITVDVAHSHNDNVVPILLTIKKYYPDAYVILGNGCTKEWIQWVWLRDLVNCAKLGIGVSKACQTAQYTGFGSSTVTSLHECAKTAKLFNSYGAPKTLETMSDGGLTVLGDTICVGDIAKALVVGADWVMSGALFSRCADSPSVKDGYYGNASAKAKGHNGHVEGRVIKINGQEATIKDMMTLVEESLRSSISYSGGRNIEEMKKLTKWEQVT
jgi:GMP reductase